MNVNHYYSVQMSLSQKQLVVVSLDSYELGTKRLPYGKHKIFSNNDNEHLDGTVINKLFIKCEQIQDKGTK